MYACMYAKRDDRDIYVSHFRHGILLSSTQLLLTGVKSWQVANGSEELTVVCRHLSQSLQRSSPLCVLIRLQSSFLQIT